MKNKNLFTWIAAGLIALFLVFQSVKINNLKSKNEILKSNADAYRDTLRITKNKKGELEYAKLVLQTDIKNLKKDNEDLYNELKKEKGNVSYIANGKVKILHDTIFTDVENLVVDTVLKSTSWNWKYFKSGANWRESISGYSGVNSDSAWNRIDSLNLDLNIVTGLRKVKDNNYEIFFRTDYPNLKVTSLEGAIIDKNMFASQKKKRWSVGPSMGAHWDFYSGKVRPYVGVGIMRSFIKF